MDLSIKFMGMSLCSPLVASSSPLWENVDNVKQLEDAGAGAVILPSLFEEQIIAEQKALNRYLQQGTEQFAESLTYLPDFGNYRFTTNEYLENIRKCKKAVSIPVIGSLNGISRSGWIRYAHNIQEAGADALELNIFYMPENPDEKSEMVEANYVGLVRDVVDSVTIPVSVKLHPFLSSVPYILKNIRDAGASGAVLFNRFYQPDIDLKNMKLSPCLKLSTSDELGLRLRWTGIVYKKVQIDIGITGGVHTAQDCIKCIAAGANVAMMTSALLEKGINHLKILNTEIADWLQENGYSSLKSLQGVMSIESTGQPEAYTRANYLQILGSYR
ncbi:MAG: dihydroorotate dehydrogenase-like protein [Chitinispirillaceae bacterium]|nr:dihydroorotate dehydrogenase-like protein [Chitinispirillaceae bacterium]